MVQNTVLTHILTLVTILKLRSWQGWRENDSSSFGCFLCLWSSRLPKLPLGSYYNFQEPQVHVREPLQKGVVRPHNVWEYKLKWGLQYTSYGLVTHLFHWPLNLWSARTHHWPSVLLHHFSANPTYWSFIFINTFLCTLKPGNTVPLWHPYYSFSPGIYQSPSMGRRTSG